MTWCCYVQRALLLDMDCLPDVLRTRMKKEQQVWCQTYHTECFAQLAMWKPAAAALVQEPSVVPALQTVAEKGLSAEAMQFAQSALVALGATQLATVAEDTEKHVMLSYCWKQQKVVQRINDSLNARGYLTWFDCKLSTLSHGLNLRARVSLS
jgi:hypothetical protein